jgi:hypothetical protein
MHRQIIAAAAASLLFFTLTGCGDDAKEKAGDDPTKSTHTADETKAIDSLTTLFGSGDNASSAKFFGPDFPHCFAETLVTEAGVDRLVEDKVLTEDNEATDDFSKVGKVSNESAAALATAEYDCIDWDEVATYLKAHDQAGKKVNATTADAAKVDDYVNCMKEIDEDDWKAASADRASGKTTSAAITKFDAASSACQEKAPK